MAAALVVGARHELAAEVSRVPWLHDLVDDCVAAAEAGAASIVVAAPYQSILESDDDGDSALASYRRKETLEVHAIAGEVFSCLGLGWGNCPLIVLGGVAACALERVWTDLDLWHASLRDGHPVDALLPLRGAWAKGVVLNRAPAPFQRWIRVAFDGLSNEHWRWCGWESGTSVGGAPLIRW